MLDNTIDEIMDIFEIQHSTKIEFKEVCGFTFVSISKINIIRNNVSAEIRPLGIIYEENDEYYFAPLHGADNIEEIIKEYVKN
jgi:hypothetical protein